MRGNWVKGEQLGAGGGAATGQAQWECSAARPQPHIKKVTPGLGVAPCLPSFLDLRAAAEFLVLSPIMTATHHFHLSGRMLSQLIP